MKYDVRDLKIGDEIVLDPSKWVKQKQVVTLQGIRAHHRVDGVETYLLEWSSNCCVCQHRYEFTSARNQMAPTRTCEVHRRALGNGSKRGDEK